MTTITDHFQHLMNQAVAHKRTVVEFQRLLKMPDEEAKELLLKRLERDRQIFTKKIRKK